MPMAAAFAFRRLFSDRPVILHLVYYECPMLCKLSSDGLLRALSTLSLKPGEDFSIVTVSFDPREGPELSAARARSGDRALRREAVENGWQFLTGDEAAIAELCECRRLSLHVRQEQPGSSRTRPAYSF